MSDDKSESTLGVRIVIAIIFALVARLNLGDWMSKENLDFMTAVCAAVGFFYELIVFFVIIMVVLAFLK